MLEGDPAAKRPAERNGNRFVLYVEGPRDSAILRAWSYRLLPRRARQLFRSSVILGGRRPARAVDHFQRVRSADADARALCVLDRDDAHPALPAATEPGLAFFTWGRRHIESYLLVPDAIRRTLPRSSDDDRMARALLEHLPAATDEKAYREVDAKRLLGPNGALPRALGRPIRLDRIAQATREHELHPDVHALFGCIRNGLGGNRLTAR